MSASIFISYSHADERVLERLHKHMAMLQREGLVSTWYDRQIVPGSHVDQAITTQIDGADIFVAIVSPDYLASNYCYDREFARALERSERGELRIVSIIAEPCDWLSSPLQRFLALPKDGKPISEWTNANTAFLDIVNGLRRVVEEIARPTRDAPRTESRTEPVRRVRLKRDFDVIERRQFADLTFDTLKAYFEAASQEIAVASDEIRTSFDSMSQKSFTCTIVNRAKKTAQEASITVHNTKGRSAFHDINYVYQAFAGENTSNGGIRVASDDYDLFLSVEYFSHGSGEASKLSPRQAAEWLWNRFVEQAGVEYE